MPKVRVFDLEKAQAWATKHEETSGELGNMARAYLDAVDACVMGGAAVRKLRQAKFDLEQQLEKQKNWGCQHNRVNTKTGLDMYCMDCGYKMSDERGRSLCG